MRTVFHRLLGDYNRHASGDKNKLCRTVCDGVGYNNSIVDKKGNQLISPVYQCESMGSYRPLVHIISLGLDYPVVDILERLPMRNNNSKLKRLIVPQCEEFPFCSLCDCNCNLYIESFFCIEIGIILIKLMEQPRNQDLAKF